jgi:hypothetical protein
VKSDFFRRGPRMTLKFGETEQRDDPFGGKTWFPEWPKEVERLSGTGTPCEVQEYGERFYRPEPSAVQKPSGGFASLNGPEPDAPEGFGRPFPVGTKRRSGPPRTDK